MEKRNIKYNYLRGCTTERKPQGELICTHHNGCCKLGVFNWLSDIRQETYSDLFEIRFKNTRKAIYKNGSNQIIKEGDIVVVEASSGHDVGIVTLTGPIIARQLKRHHKSLDKLELKKIYRKAKRLDIERWQEAITREHQTMIRSRQLATSLGLNMKIGDVEFLGDGNKAIFYYIADERVDFRELIKVFAEEFRIRIEMKQIGARQEAGLIGGIGVCGQALCCSRYISDFKSITTFSAKCQDLSLNPQRLAGQCSKLKCCINYEAAVYIDAHKNLPKVHNPLEFEDGLAYVVKTDALKGILWFSYDRNSMANMHPLTSEEIIAIQQQNKKGIKPASLKEEKTSTKTPEFMSAAGEDSISRFDEKRKSNKRPHSNNRRPHSSNNSNERGRSHWHNNRNNAKDKSSEPKEPK